MTSRAYSGYRYPRDVIQRAIWLSLSFTLSYRDVEDLLAERGIELAYETVQGAHVVAKDIQDTTSQPP